MVLNGRRLQKLPGWAKVLVFRFGKLEYSRSGHRYVSLGTASSHNASNLDFTGDCAEREAGGVYRRSPPPDAFYIWRGSAGVEGMAVKSI